MGRRQESIRAAQASRRAERVKFWIDECLTPALVSIAHEHGYEATCTRDRGHLGMADEELLGHAVDQEFVFVTNNHADFIGLCANVELHTGLIVLPQRRRDVQLPLFSDAIAYIELHAEQAREAPADWMLNRVVEVDDESGACTDALLPHH
jgi:predicted nuclease of predicted toxin-antitoxin system